MDLPLTSPDICDCQAANGRRASVSMLPRTTMGCAPRGQAGSSLHLPEPRVASPANVQFLQQHQGEMVPSRRPPTLTQTLQNQNSCCSQFWHVLACFVEGKRGEALKATKRVEIYLKNIERTPVQYFHIELLQIGISFNQGLDRSMSTHQCSLKQRSPLSAIDVVHICTFFEKVV